MKYIVLIGDGMADYPIEELGGNTPLYVADTPNMDRMAREGMAGLVNTIPDGMPPGSDVASLSILGYDPLVYYTGRSPLEAASIGVELSEEDISLRCNLVTIEKRSDGIYMDDFSAGHISTDEAGAIIKDIEERLADDEIHFYKGVSYRHLMVWRGGPDGLSTTPPHDITGREISPYLPQGEGAEHLIEIMGASQRILDTHPVNIRRSEKGLKPANSIWLWGEGRAPELPTLKERFGISGSVISAVDLVRGIGIYAGLDVIDVPGITGYIDTNYKGKAEYAIEALKDGDFVLVHVEAPDEASHNGDLGAKIRAIEDFDRYVVGGIMKGLEWIGEYRILTLSDHRTPLSIKTHTDDPVPYVIYPASEDSSHGGSIHFCEDMVGEGYSFIERGHTLIEELLKGGKG